MLTTGEEGVDVTPVTALLPAHELPHTITLPSSRSAAKTLWLEAMATTGEAGDVLMLVGTA